ncbi:hypothetical protein IE077_002055 [Cardiosporidium cionae]|uniref:Uncharacterized protein n=1 Tax=Cardiosporidium cionae TaxID=476202 RepID=A0ABQ7JGB6_9APIC|nr:hypothetical protein IE077_002055 [Cardiosporidium cionae]|eukprot:KAF8822915.1 hypothetical protein IE077_002055 [Cardiosporidium cionae]
MLFAEILHHEKRILITKLFSFQAFKISSAKMNTLVRNGTVSNTTVTFSEFLHQYPRGVYTAAKTLKQKAIYDLSSHVRRLVDNSSAMIEMQSNEVKNKSFRFLNKISFDTLYAIVKADVSLGLRNALLNFGERQLPQEHLQEFIVTLLLSWNQPDELTPENGFDLYTFIRPAYVVPNTIQVEIWQAYRSNPTLKDSLWASTRRAIAAKLSSDSAEAVMMQSDGCITEGISSNFFVIQDNKLYTAPDDLVLNGLVRKHVLEYCAEEGISVVMECPKVDAIHKWDCCFISSSNRIVIPIHSIRVPERMESACFNEKQCEWIASMALRVRDLLVAAAEPISSSDPELSS